MQPRDLKVFIGYDPRQPVAYSVLQHSIASRASEPVSIIRLQLSQLPMTRVGLTEFTYSRFLVPYLCKYQGTALFLDADMLVLDDITKLFDLADGSAVQVVKNAQKFEWPSLMLFNCERCKLLTPYAVQNMPTGEAFGFRWAPEIGDLPAEWNHCVSYDDPGPAKLVHYTQGIPVWPETKDCEYSEEWHNERKAMMGTVTWKELMGNSIHAAHMKAAE